MKWCNTVVARGQWGRLLRLEMLSNVVERAFEDGDPHGWVDRYQGLGCSWVKTNLEVIFEADTGAQ